MITYKFIPGYEGLYDISKGGYVRSYYSRSGDVCSEPQRYMSYCRGVVKKNPSPTICLYKNKKCKEYRVIDLLAKTYLQSTKPSYTSKPYLITKTGYLSDFNIENIAWK